MSRYSAAFYHLLISLLIFIGPAYLVLYTWYPGYFFEIDGGWEGMRILIPLYLGLGPLLTMAVFKAGKAGLVSDLVVIGVLQSVCLIAGLYVLYSERPLYFGYYEQHFYSNNANTYSQYGVTAPNNQDHGDAMPAFVYVKTPDNPIEEAGFRRILFQDGIPLWLYAKTYEPLEEHMAGVIAASATEDEVRSGDPGKVVDTWISAAGGGKFTDYAFIPVHARYREAYIGIRRADHQIVNIIEIPPPAFR
jgi:hypothetical protein